MSEQLYYTAPEDYIFNELQALAINLWGTYDDTHGYASEKINKVKELENTGSNFMTIWGMFDWKNQTKIMKEASDGLKEAIEERG